MDGTCDVESVVVVALVGSGVASGMVSGAWTTDVGLVGAEDASSARSLPVTHHSKTPWSLHQPNMPLLCQYFGLFLWHFYC